MRSRRSTGSEGDMLRGGTDSLRRSSPSDPPEAGNTLVLSIVLAAVAIALVFTLATVTQMHIERKRLLALADAAAIHAAAAIDEPAYFAEPGSHVPLSDSTVRAAVDDFLSHLAPGQRSRLHGLSVSSPTNAINQETAQVTLSAYIRPGYIPWAITAFEGFRIEVTSAARAD